MFPLFGLDSWRSPRRAPGVANGYTLRSVDPARGGILRPDAEVPSADGVTRKGGRAAGAGPHHRFTTYSRRARDPERPLYHRGCQIAAARARGRRWSVDDLLAAAATLPPAPAFSPRVRGLDAFGDRADQVELKDSSCPGAEAG